MRIADFEIYQDKVRRQVPCRQKEFFVPSSFEIRNSKFEIFSARVAEQQRHLTVNQAFLVNFVGASPTACTRFS